MEFEPAISTNRDIWIISKPQYGRFAIDQAGKNESPIVGQEYRISSIGRYLLSPQPFTVQKRLVGCEIHQKESWKKHFQKKWLRTDRHLNGGNSVPMTLYLNQPNLKGSLTTSLSHHLEKLYGLLRPFDSFFIEIDKLDPRQIEKTVGICEDDTGYRSPLTLEGPATQQLDFLRQHVGRPISVKLKRAYIANGLFEMKGFNFQTYRPDSHSRLIRFVQNGLPRGCVIDDDDNTVSFWVEDLKIVNYLQLLDYCINHNEKMYESFYKCMHGKAVPIRLMFNQSITIDYTRAPLPAIFQEMLGKSAIEDQTQKLIKENLSAHQMGISFNSLTQQKKGGNAICTDIAILQNLRALESIKDHVPMLFAQMEKISARSEGENFYLLEAIRGVDNES